MAGASIDAIGVINQIKDNLTDRYDNGFPVLKEIIQNADDAGASSLKIGWSAGFEGAQNELLNAPAMFFINNAPLEEGHRDAILSIAQSSKAASKTSVGKFGLGMKSLFHLGEAFFFMSEKWKQHSWASDVFNPWDKYRAKWNDFDKKDKELIEGKLKPLLGVDDKVWFIVWVPLRTSTLVENYNNKMIINNVSHGDTLPDFFSDQHLTEKTSEILPQLKHLIDIQFFAESKDKSFNDLTHILLDGKSSRSLFNGEALLSNGSSEFSFNGKIHGTMSGDIQTLEYAGCEKVICDDRLISLRTEEMGWPKSYQFSKDVQEPIEALDKAEQHSAVTFSRFKASGQAYLRANWAVFLPLADTDELVAVPIEGDYDYNMYLHGYFFVDAGRKGLHGHDQLGTVISLNDVKNDEKRLRQVWNVILASEGTFNLVLKALDHFCATLRLGHATKSILTKGLHTLLSVKKEYCVEVSRPNNWLQNIDEGKISWKLLGGQTLCLPVPGPNNDDLSRIWATLPKLKYVLDDKALYQVCGYEFLTSDNLNGSWNQELLKEVLSDSILSVFEKSIYIEYLIQFIYVVKSGLTTDQLDSILFPLLKEVLVKVPLSELSNNKGLVTELFALFSAGKTVILPIEKGDQTLWDSVLLIPQNSLLLPKFLYNERRGESARFSKSELFQLLTIVDEFIKQNEANSNEDQLKACESLISFVLQSAKTTNEIKIDTFYEQCSHLKLFKVDVKGSIQKTKYRSIYELFSLKNTFQLFFKEGTRGLGQGFGKELSATLPTTEICFISRNAIELPELYHELTSCTESACLRLLATYPTLGDKAARLALLNSLSDDFTTSDEKRGLRYLIHGSKEDDLLTTLWKPNRSTNPIWMKLWKTCQPANVPVWCEISIEFTEVLRNHHEHFIGLREQHYKDIIREYRNELPMCDFSNLDDWELEIILGDIGGENEQELWCNMPIHLTSKNERVSITRQCLMEGNANVPSEWEVHIILQSAVHEVSSCQYKWINHGRPYELMDIALSQSNPKDYMVFILEQLIAGSATGDDLSSELLRKLKSTNWLSLINSQEVTAPKYVINFSANELPEAIKVCHSTLSSVYHFAQLDLTSITNSVLKNELKRLLVPNKEACRLLIAEAAKDERYSLGKISKITELALSQIVNFPELTSRFVGWRLLSELMGSGHLNLSENKQLMLCNDIDKKDLFWALEDLADQGESHDVSELRSLLLEAFCKSESNTVELSSLRLKNLENKYVDGNKLVANVSEVVLSNLIDPQEFSIIEPFIVKSSQESVNTTSKSVELEGDSVQILREYFHSWEGRVPKNAIATFLTLFSKFEGVEKLIDDYLKHETLDSIKMVYQKKWDPICRERGPFSGKPFNMLYKHFDFSLSICSENSAFMQSIFGQRIEVSLLDNPNSLLIHQKSYAKTKKIELRKIDTKDVDKDRLIRMLAQAVEIIFRDIFGVSLRFEGDFIKQFGQSEQMDIRVTRQMILNGLVPLLQRLQVREEGLDSLQLEFTREQQVLIMADPAIQQNRSRIDKVLRQIQDVMEKNPKIQKSVLNGVRKEISKNFQYSPFSVPFELFQNADDSLSELADMLGDSAELLPRFDVMLEDNKTLNFYHWGREVNYCTSSYAIGKNRFDRDLEKMVSLNVSDKTEGKTGKFGLGFKSTLLLTDTPRVVSGDICTEIQSGVLPSIPDKSLMEHLHQVAESRTINNKIPTLIQLPKCNVNEAVLTKVLGRFQSNAGLLTVFSRHIREVNVNGNRFEWKGVPLSVLPNISIGDVKLPTNTSHESSVNLQSKKVLMINAKSGQFVFALGNKGLESLEERKNLSSFWVLNPIDEELKLGFCINAQFAVDIGRSQLAVDNSENVELAKMLGKELSQSLAEMFTISNTNWNIFSNALNLGENASFTSFWRSIWKVLTTQWPQRLGEANSKAELIRSMFTCPEGLLDFYSVHAALPCQLGEIEEQLVNLKKVKKGAGKLLTEAFSELREHPILSQLHQENSLIGHDVYTILTKINSSSHVINLEEYDLVDLMNDDFPVNQIMPEKANFYGRFFGKDFDHKMANYKASVSDKRDLEDRLGKMSFMNETSGYAKASELLISADCEFEILLSFAPKYAILNAQNNVDGVNLVNFSRQTTKFDLHNWAMRITSSEASKGDKQEGLCSYMVEGSQAVNLIKKLKFNHPEFLQKGSFNPKILTEQWGWSVDKASHFISLWLDTELDKVRHVKNAQKEFIPNVENSELVLENVANWWNESRKQILINYDKDLYSHPMPWVTMAEDFELETLEARKGWLKLFYLGSCQTLGFNNDIANRNVTSWFEDNGWWNKLAEMNGPVSDIWKELMEEYLYTARVDERYRVWIQILPLYRFATKLKDYVALFMNAAFIESLDDLLKPNSSNKLSGSGIQVSELKGTLGIGINFILRELQRHQVLESEHCEHIQKYAFVLPARLRKLLNKMGARLSTEANPENSELAYDYLVSSLGSKSHPLLMDFDLPFRVLLEDKQAFERCFDFSLDEQFEEVYG